MAPWAGEAGRRCRGREGEGGGGACEGGWLLQDELFSASNCFTSKTRSADNRTQDKTRSADNRTQDKTRSADNRTQDKTRSADNRTQDKTQSADNRTQDNICPVKRSNFLSHHVSHYLAVKFCFFSAALISNAHTTVATHTHVHTHTCTHTHTHTHTHSHAHTKIKNMK